MSPPCGKRSPDGCGTNRIVKEYVKRVASHDLEEYPEWDLTKPLPKLPVPSLNHTLDMYLKVLEPITDKDQHDQAEKLVAEFLKKDGEGCVLQKKLLEFAANTDNWAYNWWLDDMYLTNMVPLPINSNPGMVFPKTAFLDKKEQVKCAARLISGILDYKVIVDARALPIDRARHRQKGQPLCMEQYYRLFSSYREPGHFKDTLKSNTSHTHNSEHVVVICRNQLFKLDTKAYGENARLSEDDICCQLLRICRMANEVPHPNEVGALTSLRRDEWAQCREALLQDDGNKASLKIIEESIFVVCLDKAIPIELNHQLSVDDTGHNQRDDNSLALQMLHGQGSSLNSSNRWYDKTMQFIIGEDGACGLNYEHSASEGIAVVQLIEHVLKYMEELRKRKLVRMNSLAELAYPTKLKWNLTESILDHIENAKTGIDRAINNLDFYLLRFNHYGKEFPKSQNMSPDCLIQLSLQLTHYRIHKKLVSTYESASVRRFRQGRVDNIRAASSAALEWCKAMVADSEVSDDQKMELLRQAIKAQNDFMVQTILGHGMDCHMLALKRIAEESGLPTELFKVESWSKCNTFDLSTSQINTTLDSFMGYGPVTPNGYGVSYNPHPNNIVFCISSFRTCPDTRSDRFALTLQGVLEDIQHLCQRVNAAKPLTTILETELNNNHNGEIRSPRRLVRQKEIGCMTGCDPPAEIHATAAL